MSIKDLFKSNKPKENNSETIVVNKEDLLSMFKELMEKQSKPIESETPTETIKEEKVQEVKPVEPQIPPVPPIIPNPMPPATPVEVPKDEISYIPDKVQFIENIYNETLNEIKTYKEPQPNMPFKFSINVLRNSGLTSKQIAEAIELGHIDKIGDI